jgi:hypothetical protein
MFDGTAVTMPDTPKNQKAYPQVYNQQPGLGFPIARVGAIISLACGAIVNLGVCRYAGTGQGEVSLLRKLWGIFRPGDILLTDCLLANWATILLLKQRGIDFVGRLNKSNRTADFRRGKRLGKQDHIIRWFKPSSIRSLSRRAYQALPESIAIRETLIRVTQPGFRTKTLVVVTTLLDPRQTTKEERGRCTARVGTTNSICVPSSPPCRWMTYAARHPSWCERKSGRTYWPTISFAPSWLKPRRYTTSCRVRSALREPCKPWKHFNQSSSFRVPRAQHIAYGCTKSYSVPSQLIVWLTDPIDSNRD